jgi:hypothetical protein
VSRVEGRKGGEREGEEKEGGETLEGIKERERE